MTTERIAASQILVGSELTGPAALVMEGERIATVARLRAGEVAPDRTLAPGFVDVQVNGIGDVDVSTATGAQWDALDAALVAQGTTTWCPTLITAPLDAYAAPLAAITAAQERTGARPAIAGAHLEGPFLGGAPGAHPRDLVIPLDERWLAALPDIVRVVTLAPEASRAPDAIAALSARHIAVALGHSTATYAVTQAAIDAGARLATHVFNGMSALHHREPGIVGAALADPRITTSLIADLVHVHPAVIALVFAAKGADRVALVTDAVAAGAGKVRDGAPRLADGTLAGSTLTMDAAVRNVVHEAGVALADALVAASTTPARVLGLTDRGVLEPGTRADIVALDAELQVEAVWVGGVAVYGRP